VAELAGNAGFLTEPQQQSERSSERDVTEHFPGTHEYLTEGLRWAVLSVPIVLVAVMALVRSLVRGVRFFSLSNLCLGIDLCFAAIAASLVEGFEVAQQWAQQPDDGLLARTVITFCMVVVNFFVLLCVTKLHHDWEGEPLTVEGYSRDKRNRLQQIENKRHKNKQIWYLLLASNSLGSTMIVVFAYLFAWKIV
jgi:hypothetical protein